MSLLAFLVPALLAQQLDVPAGAFVQGDGSAPDAPSTAVILRAYRIDRHEVTVDQFERFAQEAWSEDQWWGADGLRWREDHPQGAGAALRRSERGGSHPVIAVTWHEADAYCRWQGGALPTEAQWERAACGDGPFPWGTGEDTDAAWFSGGKYSQLTEVQTRPVDQGGHPSPVGMLHAAGNVWEWTADWYHREGYRGGADTTGPSEGTWRTLRGGSYMNLPSYCTCTHREPARPDRVALTVGFRCAYSSSQP